MIAAAEGENIKEKEKKKFTLIEIFESMMFRFHAMEVAGFIITLYILISATYLN